MKEKECSKCFTVKSADQFPTARGKICYDCLPNGQRNHYKKLEEKKQQALELGMSYCVKCKLIKDKTCFKLCKGELTKTCIECLEKVTISMIEVTEKAKNVEHKETDLFCPRCKTYKSDENFDIVNGKQNKSCRTCLRDDNEQNKQYVQNRIEMVVEDPTTHRKCSDCKIIRPLEFFDGEKKTCLCCNQKRERYEENKEVDVCNQITSKVIAYRIADKEKSYENNITKIIMCNILHKSDGYCTYCKKRFNLRNIGLDRKDSSIGHVEDNVVPCCWSCNTKKGVKTVEEFLKNRDWTDMYDHKFNEELFVKEDRELMIKIQLNTIE